MNGMKIVTVQFNYSWFMDFALLRDVYKESCLIHMPNVKFEDIRIEPPDRVPGKPWNFGYNTVKLRIWRDVLREATEPIIFSDCDMMALRSAEHAFDIDFDVAITNRTITHRIPMNGGIVMARPTKAAIEFFNLWYSINKEMLKDNKLHQKWRQKYAGMNQSAYGCLYNDYYLQNKLKLKLHEYKTREWNAVDCDWQHVDNKTVFVHYKSGLRRLVLMSQPVQHRYAIVMKAWYDMRNRVMEKRGEQPKQIEVLKKTGKINKAMPITMRQVKMKPGMRYIKCMGGREIKEVPK
jgi:hypothetical protein